MDLGGRFEIHAIATQGWRHEFVTEYIVEYSDDGEGWRSYHNSDRENEVHKLFILQG